MIKALELTRRKTLLLGAAAFTSSIARNVEAAQDSERHGVSAFGDLKYPPDFEHFSYVNPNAPKGGVFSHVGATRIFNQNLLTFNSLNSFILRGDALSHYRFGLSRRSGFRISPSVASVVLCWLRSCEHP